MPKIRGFHKRWGIIKGRKIYHFWRITAGPPGGGIGGYRISLCGIYRHAEKLTDAKGYYDVDIEADPICLRCLAVDSA